MLTNKPATEGPIAYKVHFTRGTQNSQIHRDRTQNGGYQELGVGRGRWGVA